MLVWLPWIQQCAGTSLSTLTSPWSPCELSVWTGEPGHLGSETNEDRARLPPLWFPDLVTLCLNKMTLNEPEGFKLLARFQAKGSFRCHTGRRRPPGPSDPFVNLGLNPDSATQWRRGPNVAEAWSWLLLGSFPRLEKS